MVCFSFDEPSEEQFIKISEYWQEVIQKSPQWQSWQQPEPQPKTLVNSTRRVVHEPIEGEDLVPF